MTDEIVPVDPLDRRSNETARANVALVDYCTLGATRSLRLLQQMYAERAAATPQNPPPTTSRNTLLHWSKRNGWVERARQFDSQQHERELALFEQERIEWRKRRLLLLQGAFAKASQALNMLKPSDAKWWEVTQAISMVVKEMREEYGDKRLAANYNIDVTDPDMPIAILEMIARGDDPATVLTELAKLKSGK